MVHHSPKPAGRQDDRAFRLWYDGGNMDRMIDIHVHIGPRWDDGKDVRAGCGDLASANQAAGVSLSVASSAESLLSRTALAAPDDPGMERRLFLGNEDLLRLCCGRSDLLMTVVVDPGLEESLRQARAMLRDPKAAGIKLHPDRHRFHAGDIIALIRTSGAVESDIERILGGNARGILDPA
jgi:hypothetical protein